MIHMWWQPLRSLDTIQGSKQMKTKQFSNSQMEYDQLQEKLNRLK